MCAKHSPAEWEEQDLNRLINCELYIDKRTLVDVDKSVDLSEARRRFDRRVCLASTRQCALRLFEMNSAHSEIEHIRPPARIACLRFDAAILLRQNSETVLGQDSFKHTYIHTYMGIYTCIYLYIYVYIDNHRGRHLWNVQPPLFPRVNGFRDNLKGPE